MHQLCIETYKLKVGTGLEIYVILTFISLFLCRFYSQWCLDQINKQMASLETIKLTYTLIFEVFEEYIIYVVKILLRW